MCFLVCKATPRVAEGPKGELVPLLPSRRKHPRNLSALCCQKKGKNDRHEQSAAREFVGAGIYTKNLKHQCFGS